MATPEPAARPERPTGIARFTRAWRALPNEQRLAAGASLALFLSMLLPWYDKSFVPKGGKSFVHDSLNAFQKFSFVEAAVLLVSAGVLALLLARAERRAFHLPGGDGTILMVGGAWAALLIVYRFFDKPGVDSSGQGAATIGLQWGIFFALAAAGALAYAGSRVRAAHRPEPQLAARRRERPPSPAAPAPPATDEPTARLPRSDDDTAVLGRSDDDTTALPRSDDPTRPLSPGPEDPGEKPSPSADDPTRSDRLF